MEFRSCKGNRLCLQRGMLNLTGNKAGKVFRCDSNLENLYTSLKALHCSISGKEFLVGKSWIEYAQRRGKYPTLATDSEVNRLF